VQDALVEFERAEFPIDEVLGQFEVWRVQEKQPADPAKTITGPKSRGVAWLTLVISRSTTDAIPCVAAG
jgi:hypothetical protein